MATIIALTLLLALPAWAARINFYSTKAGTTSASSSIIAGRDQRAGKTITLSGALNFDASNAKVVMLFDASSLPANGTVPLMSIPLAAAVSTTQPTPEAFRRRVRASQSRPKFSLLAWPQPKRWSSILPAAAIATSRSARNENGQPVWFGRAANLKLRKRSRDGRLIAGQGLSGPLEIAGRQQAAFAWVHA
jgi:hypothetical protein